MQSVEFITIPELYHGLTEAQDIWLANKLTFCDPFQDAVPCFQEVDHVR